MSEKDPGKKGKWDWTGGLVEFFVQFLVLFLPITYFIGILTGGIVLLFSFVGYLGWKEWRKRKRPDAAQS